MRLIEADGKRLLAEQGVPVPASFLLEPEQAPGDCPYPAAVLKAQLLRGGRGKSGFVLEATAADFAAQAGALRQRLHEADLNGLILVEEGVTIQAEYYLAVRIDDTRQRPVLLFSTSGGIEVEANAASVGCFEIDPRQEVRPHQLLGFFRDNGVSGVAAGALCRLACDIVRVFRTTDALLVEINPLALTEGGGLVALDAKVELDDYAAFRHASHATLRSNAPEFTEATPLEKRAARHGVTFVEMDGDVAIVSGGAGLGMALVDMIADAGFRPANFVDAMGGSGASVFGEMLRTVFDRAERDDVKAIAFYLTLAATSLAAAVEGFLRMLEKRPPPKPLYMGLVAAGAAEKDLTLPEARKQLEAAGYPCVTELTELIDLLKEKVPRGG